MTALHPAHLGFGRYFAPRRGATADSLPSGLGRPTPSLPTKPEAFKRVTF